MQQCTVWATVENEHTVNLREVSLTFDMPDSAGSFETEMEALAIFDLLGVDMEKVSIFDVEAGW